jgi:hypothetical protein
LAAGTDVATRFIVNASSSLAMLAGFAIAAAGIVGLVSPDAYARLGWFVAEPPGVYLLAVVQLAIGIVLLRAAPSSRSPVGLGALGVVALAEVVLMPLIGHGRAHALAQWWGRQAPGSLRLWALVELTLGVLVVLAVLPRRGLRAVRPAT